MKVQIKPEFSSEMSLYSTDDFRHLNTMSYEMPVFEIGIEEAVICRNRLRDLFNHYDVGSIQCALSDSELFTVDDSVLESILDSKKCEFHTIYFGVGEYEMSLKAKQFIKRIVQDLGVQVRVVRIRLSPVLTQGHFYHCCRLARTYPEDWLVMVAATNHDLYSEHLNYCADIKNISLLITPKDPLIIRSLTKEISFEIAQETDDYLKLCTNIHKRLKKHSRQNVLKDFGLNSLELIPATASI